MSPGGAAASPRIRTVTELTLELQGVVAERFDDVFVRGEVTNLRRVASGHVYLSLKDAGAILPAVVWRSLAARLRFRPEDGLEVVCRGNLDVYAPHGKYQLIVQQMEPLGLGALQLAFEQLKRRLEAEGLFAPERKVPLPFLPRRIALVTSRSGAAVRDLVTVIHRRFPRVELLLVPVKVQGPGAAEEIAAGLALADRHARADVIVVGRGGGSIEDLWAFNEEVVARAIAACVTPVVSAVGHEIDVTIADLVADVRAATPSQAGELVVPVRDDLLADLSRRATRLDHLARQRVDRAWQRVESVAGRPVLTDPAAVLEPLVARLARARLRLEAASPGARASLRRGQVAELAARLAGASPAPTLAARRARLHELASRAAAAVARRLALGRSAYAEKLAAVEALSPLRVLERGFSLVRDATGALVKTVEGRSAGDALAIQTVDGTIDARVEGVRPVSPSGDSPRAPAAPRRPSGTSP